MQLLFVNSIFPQPSQTFVLDQIRYARQLGLRITILCKRCNTDLLAQQAPDLAELVVHDRPRNGAMAARLAAGIRRHPHRIGAFLRGQRAYGLHASDLACALQVEGMPDAIVANFGQNGIVAARLKQAFFPAARLAVVFHGYDLSAYVAANGWAGYRRAAPAIDLAIAVNRPWAERLAANTPIRTILVHHLGVDLDRIRLRQATGRSDRFTVLFVGRMVEKKGLGILLTAIATLKARGRDLALEVVGEGPEEETLRAQAAAAGLADCVTFRGGQPHEAVLRLMEACDCLALPSVTAANGDQEGIPVTLMEAMAAGLPVISTYHSGIPELVTDGETGLLAPERDATALAGAIERMMTEAGLAERLAAAARTFVDAEFNARIQNRKLFDLILGRPEGGSVAG
jgi:colanic acid/amylovoran biosynthesis glycosyltransferase